MARPTELDLRGLKCPMPVLRTRKALRGMVAGQRLVVFSTDPLAAIDIPHLVREQGDGLERVTQVDGLATFWIVKNAAPRAIGTQKRDT